MDQKVVEGILLALKMNTGLNVVADSEGMLLVLRANKGLKCRCSGWFLLNCGINRLLVDADGGFLLDCGINRLLVDADGGFLLDCGINRLLIAGIANSF